MPVYTGTDQDDDGEGSPGDDSFSGLGGADRFQGLGGNDTLHGDDGDDGLNGGDGNDHLEGGAGDDTLYGEAGDDVLIGGDGNDELQAGRGADLLQGGAGADNLIGSGDGSILQGGADGDEYRVYNNTAPDRVVEHAGEGFDRVYLMYYTPRYTLPDNVEALTVSGAPGNFIGNDLDNVIGADPDLIFIPGDPPAGLPATINLYGMGGDDVLTALGYGIIDGGTGADRMSGYGTFYVDNPGDTVTGRGTVRSTIDFALDASFEGDLELRGTADIDGTGNALANIILGNAGANRIDGGAGADLMRGGLGNDIYYVDDSGDRVLEADGGGNDQVFASVSFSIAGQYVERLTLTGTADIDGRGNSLANVLTGNAGDNLLNGDGGADRMAGGLGDDTYVVDNLGDIVTELAGQGTDTVIATINYHLGSTLENLTLAGTADLNGAGNSGANVLTGNYGTNALAGGLGDDIYYVQNITDTVIEAADGGNDTVYSSASFSIAGQYVETLVLTGALNVNATGNSQANTLIGNSGNNLIRGLNGDDQLYGGAGNDRLIGGEGKDGFYFDTALGADNIDRIDDFNAFDDTIHLDRAIFTVFADGQLPIAAFGVVGQPSAADARILYDPATGALKYDADGAESGAAVQFATLTPGLSLNYQDFTVYG